MILWNNSSTKWLTSSFLVKMLKDNTTGILSLCCFQQIPWNKNKLRLKSVACVAKPDLSHPSVAIELQSRARSIGRHNRCHWLDKYINLHKLPRQVARMALPVQSMQLTAGAESSKRGSVGHRDPTLWWYELYVNSIQLLDGHFWMGNQPRVHTGPFWAAVRHFNEISKNDCKENEKGD